MVVFVIVYPVEASCVHVSLGLLDLHVKYLVRMFDFILSLMLMWTLCGMYHCVAGITFRFIMQSLCNTVAIALLESVIHNNRF